MSNSSLVEYTKISPHRSSPRNNTIKKISIHHMAGNLSVERCGEVFQSRQASSNYGVGTDGRVGMYVEEKDRAWTSSNRDNDNQAITIEVANNTLGPNWTVSAAAYTKLIELCVDICKRNGIKELIWTGDTSGNLTTHDMFASTLCPGPYLKPKMSEIATLVNQILGKEDPVPTPEPTPSEELYRVQIGAFKVKEKADKAGDELEALGYNVYIPYDGELYRVQVGAFAVEENADRLMEELKAKDYSAFITKGKKELKSVEEVAKQVIAGKWGNGAERKQNLTEAGYDYVEVQAEVNKLLGA